MNIEEQIFTVDRITFERTALAIFQHQYQHTAIYRQFVDALGVDITQVQHVNQIPFLPIRFFKSHQVMSDFASNEIVRFESSGTTGQRSSQHLVQDISLYEKSFRRGFEQFYGNVKQFTILGLLPSYLERGHSSLVYMVDKLIQDSGHPQSGFYLHNFEELHHTMTQLEQGNQPYILIGVTYALLDFAEQFPRLLQNATIIETGGMKGRREELIRDEVHAMLKQAFGIDHIESEYGMTELLSQSYAKRDGIFYTPEWKKVLVRDINDPFQIEPVGRGVLNVIDLANLHSCSFIATDDVGEVFEDGSFKVNGRLDNSELRGCSLMIV